jgi:hypothetical protein
MTTSTENPSTREVTTAEEWTNTLHDPILPSGRKAVYRDVSLFDLQRLESLPTELREHVVKEWAHPGTLAELAVAPFDELAELKQSGKTPTKKQEAAADAEFFRVTDLIGQVNLQVVALALVEPAMTVEQLQQIPTPDLEMLSSLISRKTAHDAVGRRVGVVALDWFRVVTAAHGLECAPDCDACATAGWTLSAVQR